GACEACRTQPQAGALQREGARTRAGRYADQDSEIGARRPAGFTTSGRRVMARKNLEQLLQETPNTVDMLRNSQIGAYVYPVVPSEFSNWRDEQRAWRETAVLYDQSHHMAELLVEGPDAARLLSHVGVNSLANFPVDRAKHLVTCSHGGHVIGDVI